MADTQHCDHPAQPVREDAAGAGACPFKVGETVTVIGVVAKVWPREEGQAQQCVHVRFRGTVQGSAMFTPVPIDIIRSAPGGGST